jgi:methyltransferase (TIGR00027 family)
MHVNLPSLTAQFVSLFRALGNLNPEASGFSDSYAESLIPRFWRLALRMGRLKLYFFPNTSPLPRFIKRIAMQIQLRSVVIDKAIENFLPFDQLVILGAGLDSRGWRMQQLSKVDVFEVDHPATQGWKRQRANEMGVAAAKSITFVEVDFTKDKLEDCLLKAGYQKEKRTFWIWEGVTMYLEEDVVKESLRTMASLTKGGGCIAASYLKEENGKHAHPFHHALLSVIKEPWKSAYEPNMVEQIGQECGGWETIGNSGIKDWHEKFCPDTELPAAGAHDRDFEERVWVATLAPGI